MSSQQVNNAQYDDSAEATDLYLDDNPSFFHDYLDRNPELLDEYVVKNVDHERVSDWLTEVEKRPYAIDVLNLLTLNFLKKINKKNHQTDVYDNKNLIVRRAQTFDLKLYFKGRGYLPNKDKVVLVFSIGPNPTVNNGTRFRVPVGTALQADKWSCKVTGKTEKFNVEQVTVQVNIPADAIIGRYKVAVEVTSKVEEGTKTVKKSFADIIVIFNPFQPADAVYLEDKAKRDEYVLEDEGYLFYGTHTNIRQMPWNFGQFESGILNIALQLLKQNNKDQQNPIKSLKKRNSPAVCTRIFSAMVNSQDDDGVLAGNWSGDYTGGRKPTAWGGSVNILKQWMENKFKPVNYGQCWVFSGVMTTVMRAVGIPARSVTNFLSAHDAEFNMTIDKFIDQDGGVSDMMGSGDSIWNFHVWNEGWFRRPDLPKGYDGWQAIDATPQELSSGIFQCGPAPLKAIKNGEIYIGSDTNFLFAEVNADVVWWEVDEEGEVIGMVRRNSRHVGRHISTKAVGNEEREDITRLYKYPEDSEEERAAFKRAYAHCKKTDYHEKFNFIEKEGDITIDITTVGAAVNGQNVTIGIEVANTTGENKTAVVTTIVHTLLNNDVTKTLLKREKIEKPIKAGKKEFHSIEIAYADYGRHLTDMNVIRVATTVRVKETNKLYIDTNDIQFSSPDCVTIQTEGSLFAKEDNVVEIVIENPLPVALTNGIITLEGPGITKGKGETHQLQEPIPPFGKYTTKAIKVNPFRTGWKCLLVDFGTHELDAKARKRVHIA